MAINSNLFSGVQIQQPTQQRKARKGKTNPVANRNFREIPFVRDFVREEEGIAAEEIERRSYLRAWQNSSAQTIMALCIAGWSLDEIAKKFGFKGSKDETFAAAVKDAQQYFKNRIAAERLEELPASVPIQVIDSDGNLRNVDVADKLKKAATAALFNTKKNGKLNDEIKFSIVKGVPFHLQKDANGVPVIPTLRDIFNMTAERLSTVRGYAHEQYAEVFRTRDTTAGEKKFALPAAFMQLAAESAELEDSDDDDAAAVTA